ncbi:hypothetical protein FQN60_000023, partial [Etheostoma spectabile]
VFHGFTEVAVCGGAVTWTFFRGLQRHLVETREATVQVGVSFIFHVRMDHHDWQQGRKAQPVYIGVPVSHRRKRRRHRSTASDPDRDTRRSHYDHHTHREPPPRGYYHAGDEPYDEHDEGVDFCPGLEETCTFLPAGRMAQDDNTPTPTIFTEMDTLQNEGGEIEWKESASLFELRTCLQTGSILLDLEGYSLPQIVDEIVDRQIADGLVHPDLKEKISFVLLRKHRHQTKKPIHRSLADIGKSSSAAAPSEFVFTPRPPIPKSHLNFLIKPFVFCH